MGIILSRRVGSEPYYLSYEKAFDKISSKEAQIKVCKLGMPVPA
jgi:hypothetical protein